MATCAAIRSQEPFFLVVAKCARADPRTLGGFCDTHLTPRKGLEFHVHVNF